MEISPDQTVFWEWSFIKINATLVYSWVVMAVLVVISWLATRGIRSGTSISRWQNGIKAAVALIPIGRGQRELIFGDRQTGKTAVALDTIINQRDTDVVCICCSIGQKASSVARLIDDLQQHDAREHTIVVMASGDDPPGLRYAAPYAATSIGEYFMRQGRDVVVVYDDLSRHARAYRELSLLLRRPPGREAYPGDIFYIHSSLLERATHLSDNSSAGSIVGGDGDAGDEGDEGDDQQSGQAEDSEDGSDENSDESDTSGRMKEDRE